MFLPLDTGKCMWDAINKAAWTWGLASPGVGGSPSACCDDDEVDRRGEGGRYLVSRSALPLQCNWVHIGPPETFAEQGDGLRDIRLDADGAKGRTRYCLHGPEIGEGRGVVVLLHGVSMTCDMWAEYW